MKFCREIPPELEEESAHGCDFHPQSCCSVIVICLIFWALIFAASKCSGQTINASLRYNADGRTSAKLAYQSITWGAFVSTYPDVSWVDGMNSEDCFDTRSAFIVGASRQVNRMLTLSAGIGSTKNQHHCADDSWDITKRFACETSASFTLLQGRLLSLGLDAGLVYGFDLMIFSGINIGIKIR